MIFAQFHLLLLASFWTAILPRPNAFGNLDYGTPGNPDQYIERCGFTLGYMQSTRQAAWASYRLTDVNVFRKVCSRVECFAPDPNVKKNPVQPSDYSASGYDRGHLVPAEDMRYNNVCMIDSFYMTNMSPQVPGFNRGIWRRLEKVIRQFALTEKKITVVTGPIFDKGREHCMMRDIPVPERFYKVVYDETPPCKMIGFIVANRKTFAQPWEFAVSVSDVEKETGLSFFSKLPQKERDVMKKRVSVADWNWGDIDGADYYDE